LIKALRQLFAFAIEYRLGMKNPAKDVRYLKGNSEGFHSWSEDEVARFEAHHPVGSTARLALALLLHTGQRRSDVVRFGRQRVRADWLHFTQQKNRNSKPVTLTIPIHPELRQIINSTTLGGLNFLISELGQPFPRMASAIVSASGATRPDCPGNAQPMVCVKPRPLGSRKLAQQNSRSEPSLAIKRRAK
jgi:integrase